MSVDSHTVARMEAEFSTPIAQAITICEMNDSDAPAWDRFVFASEKGTFFHRAGWRHVFAKAFGLEPHFLIAERGGEIVGILPMVYQHSVLFGNALIAAPFCVEGGPLARDDASRAALDQAAKTLMQAKRADYLEFRSRHATRTDWTARKNLYATFSRPIHDKDEENLLAIPRKQRAVVRKTLKSNLVSQTDSTPNRFFRVYSESVRNLGTPVFAKRYFSILLDAFAEDCDILVILDGSEPVSAVLNFYHKDTVLPYYGGGTRAARNSGANDFLYWEVMRRARDRGCKIFDFGRSKADTGAFAFKKNWGFEPAWLEYEYCLPPGQSLPEKNPNNPKYAALIEMWKRLPLPVANFIGPFLVRSLG
jgi:FemAB-related protein (PEP-CTERM system-associated)